LGEKSRPTSNLREEKRISKSVGIETQAWLSSNPPSGSFAFDLNYLSLLDLGWPGFVASGVLVERGNPTHLQSEATWPQMFWSP